jgi:hypothetical protein
MKFLLIWSSQVFLLGFITGWGVNTIVRILFKRKPRG